MPGEWYDHVIATDDHGSYAIPSLGSFVQGYLLIIPRAHVTATCNISDDAKSAFVSFVHSVMSRLRSLYGSPVTMFEHAACSINKSPRSACVSHAHLHLVPGSYDLIAETPDVDIRKYDSYREFIQRQQQEPYLMFQDPDGPLISFDDRPSAQFFRKVIARRLDITDCWDYAAFPFYDNIKETYRDFGIDPFAGIDQDEVTTSDGA
jgi:diadenosine tetraphosphate (Ap4A) HIT family hydrolase